MLVNPVDVLITYYIKLVKLIAIVNIEQDYPNQKISAHIPGTSVAGQKTWQPKFSFDRNWSAKID